MTLEEIKRETTFWQRMLRLAGYYTGSIDGISGPLQRAAEEQWHAAADAAAKKFGRFDERTEGNLETLIPEAQAAARQWLFAAVATARHKYNLTLKVICGTRSYAEQDALYGKRPKVTNARGGFSNHNFGLAFDIGLFNSYGVYLTDDNFYDKLAKDCQPTAVLIWGGTWRFHDAPHYQLSKFGSSTAAIRSIFNK